MRVIPVVMCVVGLAAWWRCGDHPRGSKCFRWLVGADAVTWAIGFPIRRLRVKQPSLAAPSRVERERGELVFCCHVRSLNVAILNNEYHMSLCPMGSVSLGPLLLSSCRPVTQPSAGKHCEQVYFDVSAG